MADRFGSALHQNTPSPAWAFGPENKQTIFMSDFIFIGISAAFFVATGLYTLFCAKL